MNTEETHRRQLTWEGCLNVRDLGGYRTADGRETRWAALVRSDQPSALSEAGLTALTGYGIRSIVDLRRPHELEEQPNPFAQPDDHGIVYTNISLIDPDEPSDLFALSDAYTLVDAYCALLDQCCARVGRIVASITLAPDGGVMVHCAGGQDRTGIVCALLLDLVGVERKSIAVDYALSAACVWPEDQAWLADGPGERSERERELARYAARPEVITQMLAYVDQRYGGAEAYLRKAGVLPAALTRLHVRLVTPTSAEAVR